MVSQSFRVRQRVARAVLRAVLVCLAVGPSCATTELPVDLTPLRAEAKKALEVFDKSLFDVGRFTPGRSWRADGIDNFGHETRLVVVEFEAAVSLRRQVSVMTQEGVRGHMSTPAWTMKELERQALLRRVIGAGLHPAGEALTLTCAAVFEWMEPGWRLVGVDHRPHFPASFRVIDAVGR